MNAYNRGSPADVSMTHASLKHNSQAYRTFKRVYQFMRNHRLAEGDRLPPHQELARQLAVSNDTLTKAMHEMTSLGVLGRRPRRGTLIRSLTAMPPLVWSVGLATIPAAASGPGSFFSYLSVSLQAEIARRRWRCMTYYNFSRGSRPLQQFDPLLDDLDAGLIDGVLCLTVLSKRDWEQVRSHQAVACHCSFDEATPCGVIVDEGHIAREGGKLLIERGCRSLAVATPVSPPKERHRAWQGLADAITGAGVAGCSGEWLGGYVTAESGQRLADELLDRPAHLRPHGLIVLDDYLAATLTSRLAAAGDEYRPQLVVRTNQQIPLTYALPIVPFELDIHELASVTIDYLEACLNHPDQPEPVRWMTTHQKK